MQGWLIIISLSAFILSFFYYLLALMKMAPMLAAAPIFFGSIMLSIAAITQPNRFKGFGP
ncbi:hypothetical protein [Bacillus marinisedimentorum]|uniref:hypothetical protein n=1 Tax=Bacillus marinisedimentorum TaxID=1821260 RepID=UPI0008732B69|nr:hypothetical protein [Bacillus marinisedimentorum]